MKKMFVLFLAVLLLASCAPPQNNQEKGTRVGALGGAAAGALLGQAIGGNTTGTLIGAGVGAVAGGVIGNQVGKSMDEQEAAMRRELAAVEAANIQRNADVLAVTFKSDYLFAVGSANLNAGSFNEISRVSRVLNQYPDTSIQVAGHTDDTPINTTQFPSNWELSSARAISIVKFLISEGIDPDHLVAAGFGEHHPIDPGDSEAAFRRNRRIELKLTSR